MATRIAVSGVKQRNERTFTPTVPVSTPGQSFWAFFGLTALNPWPAIYFMALILGNQSSGNDMIGTQAVVYIAAITLASASWQLFLAFCGSTAGGLIMSSRGRLATSFISSGLILGLAVRMVLQALCDADTATCSSVLTQP